MPKKDKPAAHKLALSVQYPDPRLKPTLPRPLLRRWVKAALFGPAEITLRLVEQAEGQALNRDYRGKDYATNVLTFAYSEDQEDGFEGDFGDSSDLGDFGDSGDFGDLIRADIILCTDIVLQEAENQAKTLLAHSAHLIVHGVLHAQGYDHETDAEAQEMETLETEILAHLGFANPYAEPAERNLAQTPC